LKVFFQGRGGCGKIRRTIGMVFIYPKYMTYERPTSLGLQALAVPGNWLFRAEGRPGPLASTCENRSPGMTALTWPSGSTTKHSWADAAHSCGGRRASMVMGDTEGWDELERMWWTITRLVLPPDGKDRFWKNDSTNENLSWGYLTAQRLVWIKHLKTPLTSFRSIIPSQHKIFVMTPLWVRREKQMGTISNTFGANRFLRGHKIWTRSRQTNFHQACD